MPWPRRQTGARPPPSASALALALAIVATSAAADTSDDALDDVLGGFDDEEPGFEVEPVEPQAPPRWWDWSGSVESSVSVNFRPHRSDTGTDYGGLQRLRNRLNLQLDLELPGDAERDDAGARWHARIEGWGFWDAAYLINGRSRYTESVLDDYELDAEVGEAWVEGALLEQLDLKAGRQIVIWGRSETSRVLDVLNPLDNREPGRVDIEDLRRPVGMLRLRAWAGDWSFSAIAIPEIRFDRNPVVGSDFFPGTFEPPERTPDDFEDPEFAVAATGIFSGWDISFHGAWFWNDAARFARDPLPTRLVHDRLWLVGSGGNATFGGWLLKYEIAWLDGFGSFAAPGERSRLDAMLGVEYYGLENTSITLEALNRHLFDYQRALRRAPDSTREDSQEVSLRVTRTFLRERLSVTLLGFMLGWDGRDGSVLRLDFSYELRDALTLGAGVLLYQAGDRPPFDRWERNDRLLLSAKWSF